MLVCSTSLLAIYRFRGSVGTRRCNVHHRGYKAIIVLDRKHVRTSDQRNLSTSATGPRSGKKDMDSYTRSAHYFIIHIRLVTLSPSYSHNASRPILWVWRKRINVPQLRISSLKWLVKRKIRKVPRMIPKSLANLHISILRPHQRSV